jgi:hypothetical protein
MPVPEFPAKSAGFSVIAMFRLTDDTYIRTARLGFLDGRPGMARQAGNLYVLCHAPGIMTPWLW